MPIYIYGRIQTNRVTLQKYLTKFKDKKYSKELCIAPRPLPGAMQKFYYAIMKLEKDSQNYKYFYQRPKFEELTQESFTEEEKQIDYFWSV